MTIIAIKSNNIAKKGVTPVIATIILIAGTLVLALVVGAYSFGLFGSNVKTVTVSSATLYGGVTTDNNTVTGTSSLTVALNNPGSQTSISSFTLTGTGLIAAIISWTITPSVASSNGYLVGNHNVLNPGVVTSFSYFPENSPSEMITAGQTFNYVVNFANGQSVSGSLIAQ